MRYRHFRTSGPLQRGSWSRCHLSFVLCPSVVVRSHNRRSQITNHKTPKADAGFSLIEVVISTALVGLILVGAMRCFGHTLRSRTQIADDTRAQQLAHQLMTEIINTAYLDEGTSILFGPELGEDTGDRSAFDDVDDFHQWTASPPEYPDGTEMTGLPGWQREVTVEFVSAADPSQTVLTDDGVKRLTVTVRRDGVVLARLVTLRTAAYIQQ